MNFNDIIPPMIMCYSLVFFLIGLHAIWYPVTDEQAGMIVKKLHENLLDDP